MIANRIRRPPSQYANRIFLIRQKQREVVLLLLSKQQTISELRRRITCGGSTACLQGELKDQYEQVVDLLQLAEDWSNLLSYLKQNPKLPDQDLSAPLRQMLSVLGPRAESCCTSNS